MSTHCVIKVDYVGVALSGTIELGYVGNVEPFNKGRPNFRPEPVAKHEPDLMLGLLLAAGGGQEIPAYLPNVPVVQGRGSRPRQSD